MYVLYMYRWHYNCYDFEYHVKNVSGLQNEEFIVLGMGFYFKPVGSSTTLFFDDVAFVSSKRELKQVCTYGIYGICIGICHVRTYIAIHVSTVCGICHSLCEHILLWTPTA